MSQRKPIFDGVYEVSEDGKVFRVKPPLKRSGEPVQGLIEYPFELKQTIVDGRYYGVGIFRKTQYVHRLVLLGFKGPCPPGHEGAHLNGNSFDNRIENLDWKTPSANQLDRKLHGTNNYWNNPI